jgi:hypothetical protein
MKGVPYKPINKSLESVLGNNVVKLIPAEPPHVYTLRFTEDCPSQKIIDLACEIVDRFIPTYWDYEAMKVVKEEVEQ